MNNPIGPIKQIPPPTSSAWELLKKERNRWYETTKEFTVLGPHAGQELTVPIRFRFDGYTFAPDLPDLTPAAAHDRAWEVRRWDSGQKITFKDSNDMLWLLMRASDNRLTRESANLYRKGVNTLIARIVWISGPIRAWISKQ